MAIRTQDGEVGSDAAVTTDEFIVLTDEQAARFFRLSVSGCQFENEYMRWWLPQGLVITLIQPHEWRLSVVPDR